MEKENKFKQGLLEAIDSLKSAIINDNIPEILSLIKKFGIDSSHNSIVLDFLQEFLINDIKNYLYTNKRKTLKVCRRGKYNTEVQDFYKIENDILIRNGNDVKWTSVGKLYQAYKFIHNIN